MSYLALLVLVRVDIDNEYNMHQIKRVHLVLLYTSLTMRFHYQEEDLFLIWISIRVTYSPKPDWAERYTSNSTPKRLKSLHSPIKNAHFPRLKSTYLGDHHDTPEVTKAWIDFGTVRVTNKGISHTLVPSPPRKLPRLFKYADYKVTHSGKLPNYQILIVICFDGKQMEIKHWLSQFENCTINL